VLERFLLLFATYRAALEESQLSRDRELQLRARIEDLESELRRVQEARVTREQELTNRILTPPSTLEPSTPAPFDPKSVTLSPRQWQDRKWQELFTALGKRAARLQETAATPTEVLPN
jgi:hypothetical protein